MKTHSPRSRALTAAVAAVGVGLGPAMSPIVAARQAPSAKPATADQAKPQPAATAAKTQPATPQTTTQAAASQPATPIDGGWPRVYNLPNGGSVLVYQPQIASWDQQKRILAYSAVSYRAQTADKPALGTIKLEADTSVAVADRLVRFHDLKISEANIQTVPKQDVRDIAAAIDKAIPDEDRVIALDRVLANIDKSQIVAKNVEGIKADPPAVFFSKTPAVIVNLDGEPIWSPIRDNDLKFAVNTNWDLFQHGPTNLYYLRNNDTWLQATDINGPWSPAGKLPASFSKLPPDDNWNDVRANLPGKPVAANAVPKVFVSLTPAELILLRGAPSYVSVAGTGLVWVNNTESDVFRMGKTGPVYYLVAGR